MVAQQRGAGDCGLLCSGSPHRGRLPNEVCGWQFGDGEEWHADRLITVTAAPPPQPPYCLSPLPAEDAEVQHRVLTAVRAAAAAGLSIGPSLRGGG